MIYETDDLKEQYVSTLACILSYGYSKQCLPSYLERLIAYSRPFTEFENGNSKTLAFSSPQAIIRELYLRSDDARISNDINGVFGWMASVYMRLAIQLHPITFECIFMGLPLDELMQKYPVYHEMDYFHIEKVFMERIHYSKLDCVMKRLGFSTKKLSKDSGLSENAIRSFRYGYRDIKKAEAMTLMAIASALNVKPSTLL